MYAIPAPGYACRFFTIFKPFITAILFYRNLNLNPRHMDIQKKSAAFLIITFVMAFAFTAGSQEIAKKVKDKDGYIIDDPEVEELLAGRDVYQSTDIALFGSIIGTPSAFKMAGVGVNKTAEKLDL